MTGLRDEMRRHAAEDASRRICLGLRIEQGMVETAVDGEAVGVDRRDHRSEGGGRIAMRVDRAFDGDEPLDMHRWSVVHRGCRRRDGPPPADGRGGDASGRERSSKSGRTGWKRGLMAINSYPVTLTPIEDVVRLSDGSGRPYLSFRATAAAAGRTSTRTARVFGGPNVERMTRLLQRDVPIAARVAYDAFKGADGRRAQSMRIVSID